MKYTALSQKKIVPPIIIILIFAVFLFNYVQHWDFLYDDTYISMRYAKNFLDGNGLIYNLGERVEGYTNFLWVLLMILFFLTGNFLGAIKLFSLFCVLGSMLLIYLIAERLYRNYLVSLGTILLMGGNMYYVYHVVDGFETPLFAVLVLWAVYWFIHEEESPKGYTNSAIPLLFTYLTRPDGLIIVALFGFIKLLRVLIEKKIRKHDFFWLAIIIGGITLHLGWRISYYGQLWTNSYYAKKMGFHL